MHGITGLHCRQVLGQSYAYTSTALLSISGAMPLSHMHTQQGLFPSGWFLLTSGSAKSPSNNPYILRHVRVRGQKIPRCHKHHPDFTNIMNICKNHKHFDVCDVCDIWVATWSDYFVVIDANVMLGFCVTFLLLIAAVL